MGQQLATSAARVIYGRFLDLVKVALASTSLTAKNICKTHTVYLEPYISGGER